MIATDAGLGRRLVRLLVAAAGAMVLVGVWSAGPVAADVVAAPTGSISDQIWSDGDGDGNGVVDGDDSPLEGVTVVLTRPDGSTQNATTDASGNYLFDDLPFGSYTVTVDTSTLPPENQGNPVYDPDGGNDNQSSVTLNSANPDDNNQDFAYPELATLTVTKTWVGGTGTATLTATPTGGDPITLSSGSAVTLAAGEYTLAETGTAGFAAQFVCTTTLADGTTTTAQTTAITAPAGGTVNCEITNTAFTEFNGGPQCVVYGTGTAGNGPGQLAFPRGAAVDLAGNVYIADTRNDRVVKVDAVGNPTTIVAGLNEPRGVFVDGAGNVYIADSRNDRVVKVDPAGNATTVVTGVNFPWGVFVDGAGNIYIAETGNDRVVKVDAAGNQTTVGTGLNFPTSVFVDGAGNVYIADLVNNRVVKVDAVTGAETTVGTSVNLPVAVFVDGAGNVYIADTNNDQVVKVDAVTGAETTVGTGLSVPRGVFVDGAGNVYIADTLNHRVVAVGPICASLEVTKVTVPAGANVDFAFTVGTESVTLNASTNPTQTFTLGPGATTVTEATPLPDGWLLTAANCGGTEATLAETSLALTVPASAEVLCTFTNTQTAELEISKTVIGAGAVGATFEMTVTPTNPDCAVFEDPAPVAAGATTTATVQAALADETPCTYTVTENLPVGSMCSATVAPVDPVAAGGTSAFTNVCPAPLEMTITKTWEGPPTATSFSVVPSDGCPTVADVAVAAPSAGVVTASAAIVTQDFSTTSGLACTYTVTEAESATCFQVSAPAGAVAADGDAPFTNQCVTPTTVTITKTWVGAPGPAIDFAVTPAVGAPAGCTAAATAALAAGATSATATVNDLSPTTGEACFYTVTEPAVPGYTATVATVDVSAGTGWTAEFTNTENGELTITKTVLGTPPAGSEFAFAVAPTNGCNVRTQPGPLAAAGDTDATVQTTTAAGDPCTYTVTETITGACTALNDTTSVTDTTVTTGAAFTNICVTPTELIITKIWTGAPASDPVNFELTSPIAGCTGDTAAVTVTLAVGATTATSVVNDVSATTGDACTYTVTEPAIDGYTAESTTATTNAPDWAVDFTNIEFGPLTITKTVTGTPAAGSVFEFSVTATNDCAIATQPGSLTAAGPTIAITQTTTATGEACTYTIAETNPGGCTQPDPDTDITTTLGAAINNICPTPTPITITKTWVGDPGPDIEYTIAPAPGAPADCTTTTVVLSSGTDSVTATTLDISPSTGEPCTYTLTEPAIPGYTDTPTTTTVGPNSSTTFTSTQNADPLTLSIEDPYVCGQGFTGTIAGGLTPYTLTYTLTPTGGTPMTLAPFTVAAAGDYTTPDGYIDHAQFNGAHSVTVTVTDLAGTTATSTFDANLTTNCTPTRPAFFRPGPDPQTQALLTAIVALNDTPTNDTPAIRATTPQLAHTGTTTAGPTMAALTLIGTGATIAAHLRRRRN